MCFVHPLFLWGEVLLDGVERVDVGILTSPGFKNLIEWSHVKEVFAGAILGYHVSMPPHA